MSSGKVKCTCGWSWNKSDSSKKDMYICHECGRDNSNNMQNGGWLDSYADGGTMQEHQENYNNSNAYAPEGMIGDGFSNVGRNYSPAWGGQFQMGGNIYPVNYVPQAQGGMSMPGATGSMYTRIGAPSKGPRRNQTDVTDASAQDGDKVDMYGNPIIAKENHRYNIDRSYYDPRRNIINLGADYASWADKDKLLAHENYHAKQHSEGRDNFDIGHNTENRQWAEMQKRPDIMSTPEVWNNFYNRKAIESAMGVDRIAERLPESQFFRDAAGDIIYNKIIDSTQYNIPYSFEGEAQFYEDNGEEFQNGGEMRYYQNGLDWKPKSISQNGSIVKDDNGYWNPDNWGSPVEIGSNEITMQDVPFDVLGISDEGDVKHMKANNPKNYKYKGKKVTEFRMAKNGIRQEQKGLVNLNQLTNFTNYNTKQPGGWLDSL